jgi:mannitol 2-dehydrogenase
MAAAARQREEPLAFISNREIFGDLIENERFVTAYTQTLDDLHRRGARAALESLRSRS